MSGHRARRVADRVRAELARALREDVRDPRIGFVTVTGVDLSPDLRNARVYVSALGQPVEQSIEALEHLVPFLRRSLARHAGLRFTPEIRFVADATLESASRLESILRDLHEEAAPESPPGEEPDEPGPHDSSGTVP